MAGDVVHAFCCLANAEMNLHRPALAAQETEEDDGAKQTFAVTLEDAVTNQRVGEADSLFQKHGVTGTGANTGVYLLEQIRDALAPDQPREQDEHDQDLDE